ncbi:odorant receptor 131-2-like [Centroberyx affinis]|uniref:odorant receptor 131-2-like n=1 Tax=Centroberyx affinis TaxID=166261 RepID=UPI003A5C663F
MAVPKSLVYLVTTEKLADNNSVHSVGGEVLMRQINDRVIIVQVLVAVFLCINFLLIITFFKKDCFRTNMRYIFFANTLLSDCLFLILTDILLILNYYNFPMQVWLCLILCIVSSVNTCVTPITLTVMTLERYVAICMPLRHGELCTTRRALHCILIIHSLGSMPIIITLFIFFTSATYSLYTQYRICSVEMLILHRWQGHVKSAVYQLYFLIMSVTIVFSYVKIMKVAKAASGENKNSTWKGLRTVVLHAFQLLLCLIQMWCPFIEAAVLQIDFMLFINVRYFNYITFILAPRCLSPLIYGLRDETFFLALKYYAFYGLYKK